RLLWCRCRLLFQRKQKIVIENRADAMTISYSRREVVAEIYKECFIRLQTSVADDLHSKRFSYIPRLKDNYCVNGVVIGRGSCSSGACNCSDGDCLNTWTRQSQRKSGCFR